MKQGVYSIVDTGKLSKTAYFITINCHEIANISKVGQFIHIKVDGFMLRRPISICYIDKQNGTITVAIDTVGEGTKKLSELTNKNTIDIIAPIGNGFTLMENKKALIVGGGIGVAPLLPIADWYKQNSYTILGFRNYQNIILVDNFKNTLTNMTVTTDDGSLGIKGNVLKSVDNIIKQGDIDIVYSCGPYAMMREVALICHKQNVPCEVSLEEKMGCGIGACLVCACNAKINGQQKVVHICKDGPVFSSMEVF